MDEERKQLTNERTMFGGKLDKKKTGLVSTNDETKLIEDQIKELNNVKFKVNSMFEYRTVLPKYY